MNERPPQRRTRSTLRPLQMLVSGWRPPEGGPLEPIDAIVLAWPRIVGPRVAQHSQPLELQDKVLLVATRSSAWSQQLQFLEPQVLAQLRESGVAGVTQLRFRSGRLRAVKSAGRGALAPGRGRAAAPAAPPFEPAPDLATAFARARGRIAAAAAGAGRRCAQCAAPAQQTYCAPCRGEQALRRRTDLERLLFNVPWLDFESLASLVPGLDRGELEAVRRGLLQRWWRVLERVGRSTRPITDRERSIASSYVLLQSGLAPDEITPAVTRNVLGADIEARLACGPGSRTPAANETVR